MSHTVALFLTGITTIAVVFLIVKNHTGASNVIGTTGNAATSLYGTLITGNPQFYANVSHP